MSRSSDWAGRWTGAATWGNRDVRVDVGKLAAH
jgi:hypothetical protein